KLRLIDFDVAFASGHVLNLIDAGANSVQLASCFDVSLLKFRHFLERPMGIQYFKRTRARVRQLYDFVVPSRNTPFYSFDFGFEEGPAILDDLGVKGLGFLKRSAHRIWEDNTDLFVQLVYRGIRRWFLGGY